MRNHTATRAAPMRPAMTPSRRYREWEAMGTLLTEPIRSDDVGSGVPPSATHGKPQGAAAGRGSRAGSSRRQGLQDRGAQQTHAPAVHALDPAERGQVGRRGGGEAVDEPLGKQDPGLQTDLLGGAGAPGPQGLGSPADRGGQMG